MNTNLKKILLIFGGGIVLFWAFKKIRPFGGKSSKKSSKSESKSASEADKKNAAIVLTAYKEAKKAGESKAFLDEMNLEFMKEYGMKVYTEKGSGKLFVADKEGNKII